MIPAGDVDVVHVVCKTHCDLGFTDLAADVVRHYVDDFFPRALDVAAELHERGGPERMVWTTGSWVLHRALGHGTPEQRAAVAHGVERGDLAWHALPATTHTELMDADLVRSGLGISAELDARFGRTGSGHTGPGRTVAAKMTDVPGHTRSLVPILAEAGVSFLHLGVNPAWPVPDVPPVFRWQAPDGSEVVVAYQSGGYGGTVMVPGCREVLSFLHAGDNLGPPTVKEVLADHAARRERFPGAEIRASTLDAFARAVAASDAVDRLPVVTAEIGDPWLFGTASDPAKVAAYRDLLRARRLVRERLEADGEAAAPDLAEVDRSLLLVAEHTWGLDQKSSLPDTTNWSRSELDRLREEPATVRFESSWDEQRDYVDRAARLLAARVPFETSILTDPSAPQPGGVVDHLERISAAPVVADDVPVGHVAVDGMPWSRGATFSAVEPGTHVDGGCWTVGVDPVDGALCSLVEQSTGRVVADADHELGVLAYQSFDAADYERFYAQLTPTDADRWWARWDNTKPGLEAEADARSGMWRPSRAAVWHATVDDGARHELLVRVRFSDDATKLLGAPPEAWIRWHWDHDPASDGSSTIGATLWWADKPANRMPEALWFSFVPAVAEPGRWTMDKLGQPVSPLDVVRRGGRSLHGVGDAGLRYDGPDGALRLRSVDAPLVAPGRPNLLDADPPLPAMAGGWHVLLADNCWGTNFPMWIEGPASYRFTLST